MDAKPAFVLGGFLLVLIICSKHKKYNSDTIL